MVVGGEGLLTRESQVGRTMPEGISLCIRCCWISSPEKHAPAAKVLSFTSILHNPKYEIFAFLKGGHCHICAAPILHVFVPIRGVHVIRGEVQTCWPRVPTLLSVENCSYSPPTEVTFQYLPPSIFWLEENASYHFSNLVT